MKIGGQIIYSGELGENSSKLIEYFEVNHMTTYSYTICFYISILSTLVLTPLLFQGFPGVPKIKENYNPATWMLEVTGPSAEVKLGLDFAQLYRESHLCR